MARHRRQYEDDDYEYDYERDDSRRRHRYSNRRYSSDGSSGCAKLAWAVILILFLLLVGGGLAVFMGLEQAAEGLATTGQGVMSSVREMQPAQRPMEEIEEMPYIPITAEELPKAPGDCSHIHWDDSAGAGSDFSLGYKDPCWWAFPPGMQKAAIKDMQLHPEEYK